MKSFYFLLFFVSGMFGLAAQKRFDVKLKLDGFDRECIIVRPSTAPPVGGYPVVFMLHGTSGDGEKFYNISGWKELAEKENFITVFPSSLSWCFVDNGIEKQNTRWVNGSVIENPCSGPPQNYADDIKFLRTLAQMITDTFHVNKSKFFASGFSNGSAMIHKMANEMGDVFSALAGSSGPMFMTDSSQPVKRVPLWLTFGTLDEMALQVIQPPVNELPFGGDSILNFFNPYLMRALGCQGLTTDFIKSETDSIHTYLYNKSQTGEKSKPYLFSILKGMTHEYPNGVNYPFVAAEVFWDFFNKSIAVASESVSESTMELQLFPNPSENIMHLKFKGDNSNFLIDLKVFDLLGRLVSDQKVPADSTIDLDKKDFGTGLFTVQIRVGNKLSTYKFLFI